MRTLSFIYIFALFLFIVTVSAQSYWLGSVNYVLLSSEAQCNCTWATNASVVLAPNGAFNVAFVKMVGGCDSDTCEIEFPGYTIPGSWGGSTWSGQTGSWLWDGTLSMGKWIKGRGMTPFDEDMDIVFVSPHY
jgi:hypothetical protein